MPSLYAVMSEEKDRQSERIRKLQEENEQLKEAREYYQENFLTMKTERNQFKRENEQLKLSNINLEAKVFHLIDILQEKGSMTYEEVHVWWNSEVME